MLAPISSWLTNEGEFFDALKAAYGADPDFQASRRPRVYQQDQGLWYVPAYFNQHGGAPISARDTRRIRVVPLTNGQPMWNGWQLVLPSDQQLISRLIKERHDAPVSGHQGVARTLARLQQHFWSPKLEVLVRDYIRTCDACATSKPDNQHPAGLLQPLPVPSQPWEVISMDFIVKLPTTPHGHDTVYTAVDLLTNKFILFQRRRASVPGQWHASSSITSSDTMVSLRPLSLIVIGSSSVASGKISFEHAELIFACRLPITHKVMAGRSK